MPDPVNVRLIVPRVRRAVEGPVPIADAMTDDQMAAVVADAIADVVLYSGSVFGKQLLVLETENDIPTEYGTSDALALSEQSVIASQAALNIVYFKLMALKTSEKISDEAQSWEYTTSANAMRDLLKALTDARDKALAALEDKGSLVSYTSFIAVRDIQTSRAVEPWMHRHGHGHGGGQESFADPRF